jgi:UDP-N-acetylglucosamine enolpyruvyl transferase
LEGVINYKGRECELRIGKYHNGNTSIELVNVVTDEVVVVATLNLDEVLPEGQIYIKNYSENEGVLDVLQQHNVIGESIRVVSSGYVEIPICPLLQKQETTLSDGVVGNGLLSKQIFEREYAIQRDKERAEKVLVKIERYRKTKEDSMFDTFYHIDLDFIVQCIQEHMEKNGSKNE